MSTKIENELNNQLISDILKDTVNLLDKSDIEDVSKTTVENQKGEIVFTIVISIAASGIYDILKSLIKKYSDRPDFNKSIKLKIDGKEITIEEIMSK